VSQSFACPNCNAPLDYGGNDDPVIRCVYCQSAVIVPESLRSGGLSDQIAAAATFTVAGDLFQPEQLARLKEIGDLVRQGQKIEAIKLYREVFGVGLLEAKEAVEQLAEGKAITITHAAAEPFAWQSASSPIANAFNQAGAMLEVVQLAQSGQTEEAAERYSQAFGATPEDARIAAQQIAQGSSSESLILSAEGSPITISSGQTKKSAARIAGGAGCMGIVIAVFILFTVVVPVLFAMTQGGGPLEGVWARINPLAFARVITSFGGEGSGPGLFDDPRSIAVDPEGNIFVANYADGRVQKFDPDGNFLLLWNIGAEQYVSSITADRAGNLFMVYRGDIWKFDGANGKPVGQVDAFGNLQLDGLTASTGDELIEQMNAFEDLWFEAVAASADGRLVAAANSESILRFDSAGKLVFSLAEASSSLSGEAEGIEDIAVDGVGNIYVLSDSRGTVFKYSPDGKLLARFGSSGDEPGQFRAPLDIAVDGQGRIYVSDMKGIQVFANDGRYLDQFNVPGAPFGMEFNDQGELWVVSNKPAVMKYQIKP